ncbi:hypothetical protein DFQ27_006898 [Actinomortierella ambigua]|uniref:Uncharacterized protein n=1 Tax=Actinomortierella ambigua TaxID=1343610 RepID=A0A9P6TZV6_9FUNG|nr:hypothetical protein DFQ27_006898 [Actinomortierella ambigua]
MADELGFHGLTAWFAPEYESRYSSVWGMMRMGFQSHKTQEADLAVVSDENSIAGTGATSEFPAPPRPTSLPFAATTPIVPQQSPVSTEMSCDDESLVPFVPSQVSEKLERLEDYCARLCGLDLSTKNQLETALAEARTGFTLVDLFDDARRWDVRRNED